MPRKAKRKHHRQHGTGSVIQRRDACSSASIRAVAGNRGEQRESSEQHEAEGDQRYKSLVSFLESELAWADEQFKEPGDGASLRRDGAYLAGRRNAFADALDFVRALRKHEQMPTPDRQESPE